MTASTDFTYDFSKRCPEVLDRASPEAEAHGCEITWSCMAPAEKARP